MWTSFKQKLKRWRRGEASANNVSKKKFTTNYRRGKGTKWCWPWSRANNLPLAFRPIQPDLDDKSHKHGLVFWSDEGKAPNLFNLLPSDILFEEILARIVTQDEGPQNLCRLSCVCKFFYDASNEAETLKKVKISFSKNVNFRPICYENFVCKCATVGNLRAIAALRVLGSFHFDEDGGTFHINVDCGSRSINERLYASYFLGMILFESPTTRGESRPCFVAKGKWPHSESFTYFRRNARRFLLKFGIDRPLKRVEIPCKIDFCECQRMKAGYALDQLESEFFIGMTCSLSYHYELLRVASVAAFSGESDE
ncbi:hypothetical protein COLO4_13356 [Corchorus olitorius]|uniref:F-box domain-containing protein n=1 Tax=Corchorus olitorius TaxID=93759 RepID=A0A1R3JWT3_9ROSI|nr:hypothetical protein COLO4_13356 [Corchorus olitorius]